MKSRVLILSLLLLAAPAGLGVSSGCTLKPCIEDACEPTRAQITGDWAQDILGQWVDEGFEESVDPTYMEEFREGGQMTRVTLCDNRGYATPGANLEFIYTLMEEELSIGRDGAEREENRPYLIEEISAEKMILQKPVRQADGEPGYERVVKRRMSCDL